MALEVEILYAGDGTKYPAKGETVTLHYVGYVGRAQRQRRGAARGS